VTFDARPHLPAEPSEGDAVAQSRRAERGENNRRSKPSGWALPASSPMDRPGRLPAAGSWRPSPAARREASALPLAAHSLFRGLCTGMKRSPLFFRCAPHEGFSCFFDEIHALKILHTGAFERPTQYSRIVYDDAQRSSVPPLEMKRNSCVCRGPCDARLMCGGRALFALGLAL